MVKFLGPEWNPPFHILRWYDNAASDPMTALDFKKWLAVGTGIGIEIGREDLMVTAVRVRPSGVTVLGELDHSPLP